MKIFNFMAVVAAVVMFVSCGDKEKQPTIVKNDYFSLSTDGTLKAKIAEYNADDFKYVRVCAESEGNCEFVSSVVKVSSDGTFELKMNIPAVQCLYPITDFAALNSGTVSLSSKNINFSIIVILGFVDEASSTDSENRVASLNSSYSYDLIYVNGDVNAVGIADENTGGQEYDLHLKKGWNAYFRKDNVESMNIPADFQLTPYIYNE